MRQEKPVTKRETETTTVNLRLTIDFNLEIDDELPGVTDEKKKEYFRQFIAEIMKNESACIELSKMLIINGFFNSPKYDKLCKLLDVKTDEEIVLGIASRLSPEAEAYFKGLYSREFKDKWERQVKQEDYEVVFAHFLKPKITITDASCEERE